MKLSTCLFVAAALTALAAPSAQAVVVTGAGNGSFLSVTNCSTACGITDGGNTLRLGASSAVHEAGLGPCGS